MVGPALSRRRHGDAAKVAVRPGTRRMRKGGKLGVERHECGVAGHVDLPAQPVEKMRPPFAQILDARRKAFGMEAEAQDIDGRCGEMGGDTLHELHRRVIGCDQGPVPVDRERRIGRVPLEDEVDGLTRRGERGIIDRPLGVSRRIARREQQHIAFAQGRSMTSASRSTTPRDGIERPVSMKLRWRVEISASPARSSWLIRRLARQLRSCSPNVLAASFMPQTIADR